MSNLFLVINCGSSSLKFAIVEPEEGKEYLTGLAECLHLPEARIRWKFSEKAESSLENKASHAHALRFIVDNILSTQPELAQQIKGIGHRIVHGGEQFKGSVLIDESVIQGISDCAPLAPLHNPAAVAGIQATQQAFPHLPMAAVFDSAFHQTMPEAAYLYALPYKLYKENAIRKYGMHGTSHTFIAQSMAEKLNQPLEQINIISCHLGNGASLCAIEGGRSIDTSMGLTPLEGLVMGTRCGDIDPAVIFHLYNELGYSMAEIETMLTKQSGLLGLTEETSDCRFIEDNHEKNPAAKRALAVMTHRLAKYIAGFATTFSNGIVDAIVFTGGIGENASLVRSEAILKLKAMGIALDESKNKAAQFGAESIISAADSTIPVWVIATNEELMIARDTQTLTQ